MVGEYDRLYRKRRYLSHKMSAWIIVKQKEKNREENSYGDSTDVFGKCNALLDFSRIACRFFVVTCFFRIREKRLFLSNLFVVLITDFFQWHSYGYKL